MDNEEIQARARLCVLLTPRQLELLCALRYRYGTLEHWIGELGVSNAIALTRPRSLPDTEEARHD